MNHNRRVLIKKALFILSIALFSFLVLLLFPLFSFAYGFSSIGRNNVIITGVFLLIWPLFLFYAAKIKSRLLFNLHIGYWWMVLAAFIFAYILNFDFMSAMPFVLFAFFLTPLIGFHYFFATHSNLPAFILFVIIACFIIGGYYIKAKTMNGEMT